MKHLLAIAALCALPLGAQSISGGAGGPCSVAGSPTSGYVLTSTGGTGCSWQAAGSASVTVGAITNAWYLPDTGTANAVVGTPVTSFPGAYAPGQAVIFEAAATNTGATTINIASLGAKNLTKSGSTALAAGNKVAGIYYLAAYDGVEFQLLPFTLVSADITGALGYTPLNPANNLSDVASASSARTNLGLGTAATQNTGTSGATLGLLNANLTFGGSNAYGTPASINLTNGISLPISTGVSGLGTNVASFLATPSAANFASMLTLPPLPRSVGGTNNTAGAIPQQFFGTAAPGSVVGNLPGDFFSDTANHNDYWCNAPSGTAAPACTSVTTGGWTLLNGGAGNSAFSAITSGTNTTAAMVIGTGASLSLSGTGTNTSNAAQSNATDPAACTAGALEFNSTGAAFKGCTATNTWTTFGSGGSVTSITAGTGLTGGTITTSGTVAVDPTYTATLDEIHNNPNYCVDATGTTAYTCTLPNRALASYASGQAFLLNPSATCTTSCSVNINTVGVIAIKKIDGTTDPGGTLVAAQPQWIYYDGTVFRLLGGGGGGAGTVTSVGLAGTANQITITGASPITTSGSWTAALSSTLALPGTLTAASLSTVGTVAGSICSTSAGLILYEAGGNCYAGSGTAFSGITAGTNTNALLVGTGGTFGPTGTGTIQATSVVDSSQLNVLTTTHTASAVDYFTMVNGATGAPGIVQLNAAGTDANVSIQLNPKGTGVVNSSTALTIGSSAPTVTWSAGNGAGVAYNEGTLPAYAASGVDGCYADSTLHGIKCSYNNGSQLPLPLLTGALTAGHVASINSTTNLLQDSGVVAANVPSAGSNAAAAKMLWISGGADKTMTAIDFPDAKTVPAANCNNTTPGSGWNLPTSSAPTPTCYGTNTNRGVLAFTDGQAATFDFELPLDWDTAAQPYVNLFLSSTTNTSGTMIFQVATACTNKDGSITDDPTYTTAQSFPTVTAAAANRAWSTSIQLNAVTSGNNCVPGGTMQVKISRTTDTAASAVNIGKAVITTPRLLTVQAN